MKKYIIIAGVNGAGKSTLYHSFSYLKDMPRINVDDEVRRIGSWKKPADVYRAGLKTVERLKGLLEGDETFNQETTLCGKSIFSNIKKAAENGFYVEIHFVGIASSELAARRVHRRVENGGHGIPDEDIERRFPESLENIRALLPTANRVIFYDNTVELRRIAVFDEGKAVMESAFLPGWYIENIAAHL